MKVFQLADKYEVIKLMSICIKFIKISDENALEVLINGHNANCDELVVSAAHYVNENFDEFSQRNDFKAKQSLILEIIESALSTTENNQWIQRYRMSQKDRYGQM